MIDRLTKLLTIKSLVTLILTVLFAFLAVKGVISGEQVVVIYTTIIAFYFGTQATKEDLKK